ncbi:hypothetical protein BH10ACI3_BH10ACI3_16410 [soil metagenome]
MKRVVHLSLFSVLAIGGLLACDSTANNSTSNTNRSASNTSSAISNAASSVGNAANTVANAVSNTVAKMTTDKPEDFLKSAAQGGQAEVELGKLVATKAASPEVKKFGQMMIADHTKANTELKALAAKKSVAIPADLGSHQSTIDRLGKLSGADFDKAYVDDMVSDHEGDVAEFERQAANSPDADVKAFAAKTLPVLKKHLEAIKAIQAKMK